MAEFFRSISFKILGIAIGLLVVMGLASAWSMYTTAQVNRQLATLSQSLLPITLGLEDISDEMLRAEVHLAGLGLRFSTDRSAHPSDDDCAATFRRSSENLEELIAQVSRLRAHGAALSVLERNRLEFARLEAVLAEIERATRRFASDAQRLCESGDGDAQAAQAALLVRSVAELDALVTAASDDMKTFVVTGASIVEANERTALQANIVLIVTASLVGLLLAFLVARGLVRPIERLRRGAQAVQAGHLDTQVPVSSRDEIGDVTSAFNQMVVELRDKERIKQTFGQYVDPRVVNNLLVDGRASQASNGEKQLVTVYFSDLVAFTALAERLSPGGLVALINDYFATMSGPIRERHGIIDKYIGDSIMAFWTEPFASATEQARLACAATLMQFRLLDDFRARAPELIGLRKGLPLIDMRVGMASGEAIVGSIGGETSRSFTVMGDTVNLGSRLEGSNKVYGTHILIDRMTRDMAGDAIAVREIDRIAVVGKTEPVAVFELMAMAGDTDATEDALITTYEAGLAAYRAGDWAKGRDRFAECLELRAEDPPAKVMKKRCEMLLRRPPASWDGIWILTSK